MTLPDDGRILFEAWRIIMQDFVEQETLDPRLLSDGSILAIIANDEDTALSLQAARDLVYDLDNAGGFFEIQGGEQLREAYEVWAYAYEETVEDGDLTVPELNEAAIRGLVNALGDPYTSYLTASDLELGPIGPEGLLRRDWSLRYDQRRWVPRGHSSNRKYSRGSGGNTSWGHRPGGQSRADKSDDPAGSHIEDQGSRRHGCPPAG